MPDKSTFILHSLLDGATMNHIFDVDMAKEYGVLGAVLISNFMFWLKKNEANRTHFYDGKYWTYNSSSAFQELFPYASKRQIEYALKKLKEEGVIETGCYNKDPRDRTCWYTFTDNFVKCKLQNCDMQTTNLSDAYDTSVTPLPDINPYVNADNKPSKADLNTIIDEFTDNEELQETIADFIEMRKFIKKPMTEKALNLMLKKLKDLSGKEEEQIKILNQSIEHNWQTVYPVEKKEGDIQSHGWDLDQLAEAAFRKGLE